MTVAAGLEYLYAKPGKPVAPAHDAGDDDDTDAEDAGEHNDQDQSDDPFSDADDDEGSARRREEAGQDWMEAQGFDRKDR